MIGIAIANSLGLSAAAAGPDPSASAYFAATGITGATQQTAIDNLVKGLKADGLWSKMKAVYPFVTDNRNILDYTEDFSNSAWGKVQNATVTTNTFTAPNGTLTADTITGTVNSTNPTTSNGSKVFYHSGNNTTVQAQNNTITGTIYVYATTAITIQLFTYEWGGAEFSQSYTLTANTWQRLSMTSTFSGGTGNVGLAIQTNANTLYAWGAQLELGSTATTYQPIETTQQAYIANQFKYNLVNPVDSDAAFRLVFNGGWTHSSTGATPNGTNGYANTYLNPVTALTNYNAHASIYNRLQGNNTGFELGNTNTDTPQYFREFLLATYRSGKSISGFYDFTNVNAEIQVNSTSGQGFFNNAITSNTNQKLYKNGTQIGSNTNLNSSTPANTNVFIGAVNAGSAVEYNFNQYSFSSIGEGLTDTEAANLYTRVQAFQTSLSRQV